MPHAQLTTNERYIITHLHHAGVSNAEIARRLNRHRARSAGN
ncbi:MAG: helix-turn-helix domain-containing protein [Phycisphaeraceae bacterium]|nr:helix-turn-helix domain-containing protein [Phycisphaeraceae bacterium]